MLTKYFSHVKSHNDRYINYFKSLTQTIETFDPGSYNLEYAYESHNNKVYQVFSVDKFWISNGSYVLQYVNIKNKNDVNKLNGFVAFAKSEENYHKEEKVKIHISLMSPNIGILNNYIQPSLCKDVDLCIYNPNINDIDKLIKLRSKIKFRYNMFNVTRSTYDEGLILKVMDNYQALLFPIINDKYKYPSFIFKDFKFPVNNICLPINVKYHWNWQIIENNNHVNKLLTYIQEWNDKKNTTVEHTSLHP